MSPAYRLFFALWPPQTLQEALAAMAERECVHARGRPVSAHRIHMTLAFLGSVSDGTARCVTEAASRLRSGAFALSLDQLGTWRRSRILWVAPSLMPDALLRLVEGLGEVMAGCGLRPESRPFQAHITLGRQVSRDGGSRALEPALHWPVTELLLMQSETLPQGPRYTPVGRWPLG